MSDHTQRRRVFILSPYRASEARSAEEHAAHATRLVKAALAAGFAAFAPHLFYPLFLDDLIQADRDAGIDSGIAWMLGSDQVWIWDLWGISEGMRREVGKLGSWGPLVLWASRREIPAWASIVREDLGEAVS